MYESHSQKPGKFVWLLLGQYNNTLYVEGG